MVLAGALVLGSCWSGGIDESPTYMSSVHMSAFNCGSTQGGELRCWGVVPEALGGTASSPSTIPIRVPSGGTPALVTAQATQYAEHGCGLEANGNAWCWGINELGQLGNGDPGPSRGLTRTLQPEPFTSISSGSGFACGVGRSGVLYCWGVEQYTAVGPDHPSIECAVGFGNAVEMIPCVTAPVPVASLERFASVHTSDNHACALSQAGDAWCWGQNYDGQLGLGEDVVFAVVPTRVSGVPRLSNLSVTTGGTCASATDGSAWCWGYDLGGRLGSVTSTPYLIAYTPVEVPRPDGVAFRSVSLASMHACALDGDGQAWCWGTGLGVGTASSGVQSAPARVLGNLRFTSIMTGAGVDFSGQGTTCGVGDNGSWCWGSDAGDGSAQPQPIPVRVAGQGSPSD